MMKSTFKLNGKNVYTILSLILFTAVICFVDTVIQPGYWVKSAIKVLSFLAVLTIYFILNKDDITVLKKLFIPKKRDLFIALGIGVTLYAFLVGAYFLLRDHIDFSGITGKLTSDTGVSKDNFLFVALYISVVNSLLEELMFRGFGGIILKKSTSPVFAYILSSLLFAIYHGGMTSGYFHAGIFLFTLFALFIGGMIFVFLNHKSETIYASWLTHMFANLGINTVGAMLFGIIKI